MKISLTCTLLTLTLLLVACPAPIPAGRDAAAPVAVPPGTDAASSDRSFVDRGAGLDIGADDATADDAGAADADSAATDSALPDLQQPDMGTYYAHAGDDQQVALGDTVSLSAAASVLPAGASEVVYAWSFVDRPASSTATLAGADTATASFTASDPHGRYELQLDITADGDALTPDSVVINVHNSDPVANAGEDTGVYQDGSVQLNGSASSDADGDELSFTWSVGDGGSLSGADTATPTFTAASGFTGTVTVTLSVEDGFGGSDSDSVDVVVQSNLPPQISGLSDATVAHACSGAPLRCTASASLSAAVTEPEGEALTLLWSLLSCPGGAPIAGVCPGGAEPSLSTPSASYTSFHLDEASTRRIAGDYVIELAATDTSGNTSRGQVTLTVSNQDPTLQNGANISLAHIYEGGRYICRATLTPNAADADGDVLDVSYIISPQAGSVTPGLGGTATFEISSPTPDPALLARYSITVDVDDGQGGTAQSAYTVQCTNSAPTVSDLVDSTAAGHSYSSSTYSRLVEFSGTVDDAEGDPLDCEADINSPASGLSVGSMPASLGSFSSLPATASFSRTLSSANLALVGTHSFTLRCDDGFTRGSANIDVSITNRAPTGNAGGDMTVHHSYLGGGSPYRGVGDLNTRSSKSSASDPDGDPVTRTWTFASSGAGLSPSVSSASAANPTWTLTGDSRLIATHTVAMEYRDPFGAGGSDSANITVDNRAPTVSAGADLSANHSYASSIYSATFGLNGRSSKASASDPDGDPVDTTWSEINLASGVSAIYNPASLNPSVVIQGNTNVVRGHTLKLTATDSLGRSSSDNVVLTALNRAPGEDVASTLSPSSTSTSDTCYQPSLSLYCHVGGDAFASPFSYDSNYSGRFVDPDGDPIDVTLTVSSSDNAVGLTGYGQTNVTSLTVSSSNGAALDVSAVASLRSRSTIVCSATLLSQAIKFTTHFLLGGGTRMVADLDVVSSVADPFTSTAKTDRYSISASSVSGCK